jgi:copper resistance protein B
MSGVQSVLAALLLSLGTPGLAQEPDPHAGHGDRPMDAGDEAGAGLDRAESLPPPGAPPEAAFSGPRHAADSTYGNGAMARARQHLRAEHGAMRSYGVMFDRLEVPMGEEGVDYLWEAQAWYGGDLNKLLVKSEGEGRSGAETDEAEVQVLWKRAVTTWFDVHAGVRYDWSPEPGRGYLVLGVQGLMPYRIEVDAAAFLSEEGDLAARFEAEYDVPITQRLILQPAAEIDVALQEVPERRLGRGLNGLELGFRLRYEVAPEFAPYGGVHWERKLGQTADLARLAGDRTDDVLVVAGVNFWF